MQPVSGSLLLDMPFDVLLCVVECTLSPETIFSIACLCTTMAKNIRSVIEYYFQEAHWHRQSVELSSGHRRLLSYPACRVKRLCVYNIASYQPKISENVLANLTDLEELDARDRCRFYFTDDMFLNLPNLKSINAAGNRRFLTQNLGHLSRLTSLNISRQHSRRHCPIATLPQSLTSLDISDTICPFLPTTLEHTPLLKLVFLNARDSDSITGQMLKKMTSLQTLIMSGKTTYVTAEALCTLTQLKSLTLAHWLTADLHFVRKTMTWSQVFSQ